MEIKKANIKQLKTDSIQEKRLNPRPDAFDDFIWQKDIKNILKSAVLSAIKRNDTLGHILFSGDSWFWKTTLSNIIANSLWKNIKIITAYAMEKPADMISVLNQLEEWDILFIDEIHRLKPKIEEILYIAMEDFRVDIIMQDESMSLPINKFTLIWATNKLESLSDAFKNRFVYKFHLQNYTDEEKEKILEKYLSDFWIKTNKNIIKKFAKKCLPVPREIKNLAIKTRDYLVASGFKEKNMIIDDEIYLELVNNLKLENFWLSDLQKRYLEILKNSENAVWLNTIANQLNVDEKVIEEDIEPLLINLNLIEKTSRGRKIKN